jgi:hypothetical protein
VNSNKYEKKYEGEGDRQGYQGRLRRQADENYNSNEGENGASYQNDNRGYEDQEGGYDDDSYQCAYDNRVFSEVSPQRVHNYNEDDNVNFYDNSRGEIVEKWHAVGLASTGWVVKNKREWITYMKLSQYVNWIRRTVAEN